MAKKQSNVLMIVGGVILILILIVGYLGFIPGLSDLMGSGPKDLGVRYTQADYQSALAKMPGQINKNTEYACFTCTYKSSGSIPVNTAFTQEELTAFINHLNSKKGPLKNAQLRLNADGSVELSGRGTEGLISTPIYAKGRLVGTSSRGATIVIDDANAGKIGISKDAGQKAADELISYLFSQNPGLTIDSLAIKDGAVDFEGTVPQNVEGDPNAVSKSLT